MGALIRGAAAGAPSEEVRATLLLQRLPGVGDVKLERLVERFGSATAALGAPYAAFMRVAGSPAAQGRWDPELHRRVERALRWCRERGVEVVHRGAPSYPRRLAAIANPPGVIFLQGDRSLLDREIVTIVGSRRSTEYGRRVAREVATAASRSGAVVASGLAVGIDGEAHGAALEAGGKTLAVTGSGLRRPYPRCHTRLFRRIAREGLLVSEFMPEEPPLGRHFLQRNRTLAALANVVVVVEAARESGALNTVGHAMELGREVLTVPGPIYARTSEGTNGLLGAATALVRPTDLVDYLSAGRPHALSLFPDAPPDDVGADALRIWDALAETSRHVDELAHEAHLAPGPALVALSQLELGGWVRQEAGGRFARGPGVS